MRILVTGTRDEGYPPRGVSLAFDLIQKVIGVLAPNQPVVIVHGDCPSGVDNMAKAEAAERGWTPEPHPADWVRCSPLCEELKPSHRRTRWDGAYCPLAGHWRNKQMVDLHRIQPYRLCLALPNRSWSTSKGTYDCFTRAQAAGIECVALDTKGHFFQDVKARAGVRK